jgi:SpoIVB peptidase S55
MRVQVAAASLAARRVAIVGAVILQRLAVLVTGAGLVSAAASFAAASSVPTLSPGTLHPGQKAVVHTVFTGSVVDSFDAEIVGVMEGGRAEGAMILARATSERVARTGIAQGMSGSPVTVGGRLVGALSSGWAFSREPLFGITPIGEMLDVLDLPSAESAEASAGPSGADPPGFARDASFGSLRWDVADAGVAPLATTPSPSGPGSGGWGRSDALRPLPLPLACGGLNPGAARLAAEWLEPLGFSTVPGGHQRSPESTPASVTPGAAVAVEVMRGDLNLSAIGTLTYVDGDHVLLFGHPFFQSGGVRMPLATADITTIVASDQISFKLGTAGREIGAVTQDRRAAVSGELGSRARMIPVDVLVAGVRREPQRFHFESIEDRGLAPVVIPIAALNSLLESGGAGGNQTLRWTLTLTRGGQRLVLTDVSAGDAPPNEVALGMSSPLRFLFANPFGRLTLDHVDLAVQVEPGRRAWTLRSAQLLDPVVRPGSTARIECVLDRWRGGRDSRVITLDVPEELPPGRYTVWVGGGPELNRFEAARLPGRYRVSSLDDAWRRMAEQRSSGALYAALYAQAPEVTVEGRDYPELPLSALAVMGSEETAGEASRRGGVARVDERREPFAGPVRGELTLALTVDRRAPSGARSPR